MKKLLALTLALAMALSLGVAAFAEDAALPGDEASEALKWHTFWWADEASEELSIYGWFLDAGDKLNPGLDVDETENDSALSGSTLYLLLQSSEDLPDLDKEVKIKVSREDGSKQVLSAKLVEKKLPDKEFLTDQEKLIEYHGDGRVWAIEVKLKEFYNDDEFKISFKLTATAKKDIPVPIYYYDLDEGHPYIPKGTKCTVYTAPFWVTNRVLDADQDFAAGNRGETLKPAKNDDSEITWENENDTLAWLRFSGNDDQGQFYPKMVTGWDDQTYAEYFADQDAFLYDFVARAAGETKIASTSRATLDLRYPFVDEDGELTVEPEDIVVYMIDEDGLPADITSEFQFVETDDGDYVLRTKTRKLGVYIIAEKPITADEEAAEAPEEAEIPAETVEEAPAEEAPAAPVKAILPSFAK
ncbi:hypothetical protein [uncultured Anaerotruncus sp.]|uniref:hypothetical protein n=1 Tax=uncultured Anaerotruncus sp. TaxID=905011 RepID=UPI00280C3BEB|nr:hypothetical protein [uncultured Anaerotruncus sp.]